MKNQNTVFFHHRGPKDGKAILVRMSKKDRSRLEDFAKSRSIPLAVIAHDVLINFLDNNTKEGGAQ